MRNGDGNRDNNDNNNNNRNSSNNVRQPTQPTCDHPDCILNSRNGRMQCLRALANDPAAPPWARELAPDGHSWASTHITDHDAWEADLVARAERGERLSAEEVAMLRARVDAMAKQLEAKKKRLEEAKKRESQRRDAKGGFHLS